MERHLAGNYQICRDRIIKKRRKDMIDKEDIEEVLKIVKEIEEFKPAIEKIIDSAIGYGPQLSKILSAIADGMVDMKARIIRRYIYVHGFTNEEAIMISVNQWKEINEYMTSVSKNFGVKE